MMHFVFEVLLWNNIEQATVLGVYPNGPDLNRSKIASSSAYDSVVYVNGMTMNEKPLHSEFLIYCV
ncbi:hypothetical protein RchiOBHm_Chr5g0040791 [Rosa chinensis]|uniref:Uncharacterized protein n=1 Tax=Rosa chinensis TaxID=74649 RepID=A0A2P6QCM8_ROSCH|nr:hypothetical protein RchiOBHm_Chr5g0040791 [Rosa chinensis]